MRSNFREATFIVYCSISFYFLNYFSSVLVAVAVRMCLPDKFARGYFFQLHAWHFW